MKAGSVAEGTPSAQRPEPLHYAKKQGFSQLGNFARVFMWLSGRGFNRFTTITRRWISSLREFEVDFYCGLNVDRGTIQLVRSVTPLTNGSDGGISKRLIRGSEDANISRSPCLVDR